MKFYTYRVPENLRHRGGVLHCAIYKNKINATDDSDVWVIGGIRHCLAQFVPKGPYYIVPAYSTDEDKVVDDDGPYKTRAIAAVSATLQEDAP